MPAIYDPATTIGSMRSAFPGNAIPSGRDGCRRASRCCSAIRCRRRQAPRTTSAGPTTRSTIRINGTCGSITSSRRTISAFGRLAYFRDGFVPVTPLPDGSGVAERDARPAGHHGLGVRLELSAHVRRQHAERGAHRRYAAHRRPHRGAADDDGRRGAQHPGHSVDGAVPEHAADLPHQRLPAARLAAQYRIRLQHQCFGSRRLVDLAEGPPYAEDGPRLALGAPERDPAAVADRIVHVQRDRQRPARRGQHRNAVRELPARPGAELLDRSADRPKSRSARTSRSTSSRTTGRCRID